MACASDDFQPSMAKRAERGVFHPAPGTDQTFAGTSMRLKPGEERMLDIQLQPDAIVHAAKCGIRMLH